jgi:hypothetical protein
MEYATSVKMQQRTFISCKNCKLWFPVTSDHSCFGNCIGNFFGNSDDTLNNYNVNRK